MSQKDKEIENKNQKDEPPFVSLAPIRLILLYFFYILIVLSALHILGRFLFISHMESGEPPYSFSRVWIWLMTATDDIHTLVGISGLYILGLWLKRARSNIEALRIRGALSSELVRNTIIPIPHFFILQYEQVVIDVWRLTAKREDWGGSHMESRPSGKIPFIWWVLLSTITVVHLIYYSLSADYYGTGSIDGQIFVSWVSVVLFSAVIIVSLLSRLIVNKITQGQDELALMFDEFKPDKFEKTIPVKTKLSFIRSYVGIFLIITSSFAANFFIDHFAPDINYAAPYFENGL
jgi:hypothetical protein